MSLVAPRERYQFVDVIYNRDVAIAKVTAFRHVTSTSDGFALGEELFGLYECKHKRKIVVNLQHVEYLCNTAFNRMKALQTQMKAQNGKLVLCNVGNQLRTFLEQSLLLGEFTIVDSCEEAMKQF